MHSTAKVLELFAGPGGFSESLRMVGLTDTLGIEFNADACATAQAAGHARLHADVRDVTPEDYTGAEGCVAGPPCPTFCASGLRSGIADYELVLRDLVQIGDAHAGGPHGGPAAEPKAYGQVADERTGLVGETLKFALRVPNLRWLVAEQVPDVARIWKHIAAELVTTPDNPWTTATVLTLRADDFGAATRRARTFLVATRDLYPDFTGMPIRDILCCDRFGADGPEEYEPVPVSPFATVSMAQALGLPPGLKVNTRGARKTAGGNWFRADGVAPSLTGNSFRTWFAVRPGEDPETFTLEDRLSRRFTPAQGGVLQGFSPDYPWQGSRTSQCQRIADAVSPLMGAAVIGAATGRPWQAAVKARLAELYGVTGWQEDLFDAPVGGGADEDGRLALAGKYL